MENLKVGDVVLKNVAQARWPIAPFAQSSYISKYAPQLGKTTSPAQAIPIIGGGEGGGGHSGSEAPFLSQLFILGEREERESLYPPHTHTPTTYVENQEGHDDAVHA